MKKIVIKMRNMKKMVGDDLLKLALMLSLLKVDPQAYLGWSSPQSSGDPGGSSDSGETWTQTMLHNPWIQDNGITSAPSIHPKSLDSILERHQQEILEDLNSLGRYSRLSAYAGVPVHISAFIVDTDQGPSCCQPDHQDWGEESDSGISDTAHSDSDDENIEKEKNPEESEEEVAMDLECETILFDSASPLSQVQGLDTVMGLTPPPESSLLDLGAGQDALEAELVHIDEQLMNIEDDLGHIDEAFVMMDQQLAESISEDVYDNTDFASDGFGLNLDTLGVDPSEELGNPFDDWQRDALADIEELALDNVDTQVPSNVHPTDPLASSREVLVDSSLSSNEMGSILRDPDLFPTDQATSGSAILEDFDEDLFGGSNLSKVGSRSEQVVRQDVALPQMETEVTRASLLPRRPPPPPPSREDSVDKELLEQVSMAEVEEGDEDLIMRVLRESNIDFDEIPLTTENIKEEEVKTEILKEEEIKEEVIDVEDVGFELSLTDGASAKVEIDYEKLHEDIKSNFESVEDGSEVAEFTFAAFDGQQSASQHAFHHDHNYLGATTTTKEGPAILGERAAAATRRRNASESSGYSSMTEDQATISSRCRDEKMAKKMNLPFSTWEVINSPVDTFSEMLARPGLTSEQVKLCRDIRRRGKNKVAAQNCRKRKLDTIEELQSQVGQVQRRKAQLLREREQLEAERARWSSKLSYLEETVLAGAGKSFGMFTLEVTDNAVVVTSRMNSKPAGLLAAAVGGAEKQPRGGRSRD